MRVVILTPFFYPSVNGMTLSSISHAELVKLMNEGSSIQFLYFQNFRFKSYDFDNLPYNSNLEFQSFKSFFHILKLSDLIILEGWSHPLLFLFCLVKRKTKVLFSHGSYFPTNSNIFSIFKFVIRQIIYLVPNLIVFFGNVRIITLMDSPDFKRFRDVLFLKLFNRKFDVIPNFSFYDEVKFNCNGSNKFLMVAVGDNNKGQFEVVKFWQKNEKQEELHLFFPTKNNYTIEIENYIKYHSISSVKIHYGKDREQICIEMLSFAALIVNSWTECQSLSVIDALVCNLEIVSTKTGRYFNEDYYSFHFFERGSQSSFFSALESSRKRIKITRNYNNYCKSNYYDKFKFEVL
jgi:hypothetical protein